MKLPRLHFFYLLWCSVFENQIARGCLRGNCTLNADPWFLGEAPNILRLVVKDNVCGQKFFHLNLNRVLSALLYESGRVIYHRNVFVFFVGAWKTGKNFEILFENVAPVASGFVAVIDQKLDHNFFRSLAKYRNILSVATDNSTVLFQSVFCS